MNNCLLEVVVLNEPKIRYTQDNQTPLAEMSVQIEALRQGDPPSELKVVGWGTLAQELQNNVSIGQRIIVEGRLRMNTIARKDGTKEKKAEFTLSRMHPLKEIAPKVQNVSSNLQAKSSMGGSIQPNQEEEQASWNASPLIPDTDEIPF